MDDDTRILPAVGIVAALTLAVCIRVAYAGYEEATTPLPGDHLGICSVWEEARKSTLRVEDAVCQHGRRERHDRPPAMRWWPVTDPRAVPPLGGSLSRDGFAEPPAQGAHRIGAPEAGSPTVADA